ncbi:uncharacterized protein EI90DRAFT_3114645 [Cantharellus anzutake]|uniref:uncharacterized protein n=1 Tax=Cantharellus anzutake TaxID=1750568 RepID=UPI001908915A|nr:uncharacterized protein EI90DRAFT_3114645 [Cantharellus anzutake]KAF8344014.1 hypothetical protein EI90DRAFT_3114645 [Cantharellus anzutake]
MSHSTSRPWYYPARPQIRRRRDATRVLAGAFDLRPLIHSYPPPPPFEERDQTILGIYPNGITNDFGTDLPADGGFSVPDDSYPADRPHVDETAESSARQSGKRAADRVHPPSSSKHITPSSDSSATAPARKSTSTKNAVASKSKAAQPPTTQPSAAPSIPAPIPQPSGATKQKSGSKRPSTSGAASDGPAPKKLRLTITNPPNDSSPKSASTSNQKVTTHQKATPVRETSTVSLSTQNPTPPAEIPPTTPESQVSPAHEAPTRTRTKKGWKGWVEAKDGEELPKDKLVNLDSPQLLASTRTTRSGTSYTAWSDGKWQKPPAAWGGGSGPIDGAIIV